MTRVATVKDYIALFGISRRTAINWRKSDRVQLGIDVILLSHLKALYCLSDDDLSILF